MKRLLAVLLSTWTLSTAAFALTPIPWTPDSGPQVGGPQTDACASVRLAEGYICTVDEFGEVKIEKIDFPGIMCDYGIRVACPGEKVVRPEFGFIVEQWRKGLGLQAQPELAAAE